MTRTAERDPAHAPDAGAETRRGPVIIAATATGGAGALRAGQRLASTLGTDAVVVTVVEQEPVYMGIPEMMPITPEFWEAIVAQQREAVEERIRETLAPEASLPVATRWGEPASIVAAIARQRRASFVVVGSGRHRAAERLLLGEPALRIVRRVECPVLVVPHELLVPGRVAVVALDFSPSSVAAARAALPLLGDGATLHLVHVWCRSSGADPWLLEREAAYERALPDRLARVARTLAAPPTVTVTTTVREETGVVEGLLAYASSVGADFVAAGRQSHSILERLFVGSVTTGLVRAAHCALLVTPMPLAAERDELARFAIGTSESRAPEEWTVQLDSFSQRNQGRRTVLEVDDPRLGAQTQVVGYALLGATYDARDARVELMFGGMEGEHGHLTRTIPDATAVGILTDAEGRDVALRVAHDGAQTLLTFMPAEHA
ncbi:MAG TPA: universal stress protein [Gemmatimonadaceae bacterium]|nr:universal stress protein [Gemmatimonadaceae bacterium]